VLPSLREHLYIELYPERISLLRTSRGWQPRELARINVQCGESVTGESFTGELVKGEPGWASALRSLQQQVSAMAIGKANATVVLSNHFVRYVLLAHGTQFSNDREEEAYARHCFLQTYGGDAEGWSLRLSANGYGKMQVASAVDQRLLDELERVARACRLHLTSVQPNLMAVFNRWHKKFSGPADWLVLVESGRLNIALLKHGNWCGLHTMKTDDGWVDRLPQLLERVLHVSGHSTELGADRGKVYLVATDGGEYSSLSDSGWTIHRLKAPAALKINPALAASVLKSS